MTILEKLTGNRKTIKTEKLIGPRGGTSWGKKILDDGNIIFLGPDTHGYFPGWLNSHIPFGKKISRAGGTTYKWAGWITKNN